MSSNQIIKSVKVGTLVKGGKQVALGVATQTQRWTRPESIAVSQGPAFVNSVSASPDVLPEGTAEVVSRDDDHPGRSDKSDRRDHYTACCYDANGAFISTEHIAAKK